MAEREIKVGSSVSWTFDRLRQALNDRIDFLREGVTNAVVPYEEYGQIVGRIKELKRMRDDVLTDIFAELGEDEDDETEDL